MSWRSKGEAALSSRLYRSLAFLPCLLFTRLPLTRGPLGNRTCVCRALRLGGFGRRARSKQDREMASAPAPKVARGIIWQHSEIMDLLDIWGTEKIQALLKGSKRNITIFEDVAREMAQRGHQRSAQECRTKTKSLRQDYKNTVVHNSKSGNAPRTCPYFDRLREILHGDASIIPKCVASSLQDEPTAVANVPEVVQPVPANPNSQEMFGHNDLAMVNIHEYMATDVSCPQDFKPSESDETDVEDTSPPGTPSVQNVSSAHMATEAREDPHDVTHARMLRHMEIALSKVTQQCRGGPCTSPDREMQARVGQNHPEIPRANTSEPIRPATPTHAPETALGNHDPNDLACLSPPSRLRLIRGRDKRPRGLMRMDVMQREFLQQHERQHRECLRQSDLQHRESLQLQRESTQLNREQKERHHQELMKETIAFNKEILVNLNRSVATFNIMADQMERLISHQIGSSATHHAVRNVTSPVLSSAPAANSLTPPAHASPAMRLLAHQRAIRRKDPSTPE